MADGSPHTFVTAPPRQGGYRTRYDGVDDGDGDEVEDEPASPSLILPYTSLPLPLPLPFPFPSLLTWRGVVCGGPTARVACVGRCL